MVNELIIKELPTVDYMLRTTWNSVAKSYSSEANKFDMTMPMGFTLFAIDPVSGTSSTALGPRMGMEPTSLSRTLKTLENKHLIERHPNPNDGRGVIIKLTESGMGYRNIAKDTIVRLNNAIVEKVGREKISIFHEVCQNIQKLVEDHKIYND